MIRFYLWTDGFIRLFLENKDVLDSRKKAASSNHLHISDAYDTVAIILYFTGWFPQSYKIKFEKENIEEEKSEIACLNTNLKIFFICFILIENVIVTMNFRYEVL